MLPEKAQENLVARMKKKQLWKCGSGTVLREGWNGVALGTTQVALAEGAENWQDALEEAVLVVKHCFDGRSSRTGASRKMVMRWKAWEDGPKPRA